jgi:predicted NAD/FAD-binding protein
VIVSLNPVRAPRPDRVLGTYDYAHPVFDAAAIAAQRDLPGIQGRERIWYAGAWTGYGFHEDGAVSGLAAAAAVLAQQRERHAA